MIQNSQYRTIPTDLQLNGPILSFVITPSDVVVGAGESTTLVGVVTAQFPSQTPANPAVGFATGNIEYQWYEVTDGQLSDGTKYVGTATTQLTILDANSPSDNGKQFYISADYVAIGTSPNANNELLTSSRVTLGVNPEITINTQPASGTAASGLTTTFTVDASLSDSSFGSLSYQWQLDQTDISDDGETSGSNSPTLSISRGTVGVSSVRVLVSAPSADTVTSTEVSYTRINPRSIIKIEGYGSTSTATLLETDLDVEDFVISADNLNFDDICFYASEKDIELEVDLFGAKGNSKGNFGGGEGGFSRINFTLKKNEEYIVRGIKSNSALFLYRKASLIAVAGAGGDAGTTGQGGDGGGINLSGTAGQGGNAGSGGPRVDSGALPENGTYGSASSLTLSNIYPEDGKATGTFGGTAIKCSKGVYWRDQGKSPCEDLGSIKFRLSDGTEVTNSATIDRGFKAGYSINRTAGAYDSGAGFGGDGATGGDGGGAGQGGGGGGSGYTDGSTNLTRTQLGGNNGTTRIGLRIYEPGSGFYIDDDGRILIFSTSDTRDPREITKTTEICLPQSNTCIDDARWQNFVNLARDGTKNYRLTATSGEGNTRITAATEKNIFTMLNGNALTLRDSLTGWVNSNYAYTLLALAWDETSNDGMSGYGGDYSMLTWSPRSNHGYGFYGGSSNPFFTPTSYNNFEGVNMWILPPGVPDFPTDRTIPFR